MASYEAKKSSNDRYLHSVLSLLLGKVFLSIISLLILFARVMAFSGALLFLAFSIEHSIRIHTKLIIVLAVAKLSYKMTCCALSG